VHFVSLDFVSGRMQQEPGPHRGEMWGGFALALLHPEPRRGVLRIAAHREWSYQLAYRASAHWISPVRRAARALKRRLRAR